MCLIVVLFTNTESAKVTQTEIFRKAFFMTNNPDAISAHEHTTWQGAAETYAKNMSLFTAFSGQVPLLIEVGDISSKDTILELGCE